MLEFMAIIWIALAIAFLVAEIMTITFYIAPFSLGSLAALIAHYLGASIPLQCLIFALASTLFLFTLPRIARAVTKASPKQTIAVNRVINQQATVTKEITAQSSGQVDVGGELWLARLTDNQSTPLKVHDICRVINIDGTHLLVQADNQETNQQM